MLPCHARRAPKKTMLQVETTRRVRHPTGSGVRCPRTLHHRNSSCLTSFSSPLSTSLCFLRVMMERFSGSTAGSDVIAKYASPFKYHSVGTTVTAFCTLLCHSVRAVMSSHSIAQSGPGSKQPFGGEFHCVFLVHVCVGWAFTRTCRPLESYVSEDHQFSDEIHSKYSSLYCG